MINKITLLIASRAYLQQFTGKTGNENLKNRFRSALFHGQNTVKYFFTHLINHLATRSAYASCCQFPQELTPCTHLCVLLNVVFVYIRDQSRASRRTKCIFPDGL